MTMPIRNLSAPRQNGLAIIKITQPNMAMLLHMLKMDSGVILTSWLFYLAINTMAHLHNGPNAQQLFLPDPVQLTLIRHGIQRAIGTLGDIPESLVLAGQQSFLTHNFIVFNDQPANMHAAEARNE